MKCFKQLKRIFLSIALSKKYDINSNSMTRVWYKFKFLISLLGNLILVIISSQEFVTCEIWNTQHSSMLN